MFGTSHLYVFHHPAEMQSSSLKQADITYEMAQEEIAKNAGLDVDDQESKGDWDVAFKEGVGGWGVDYQCLWYLIKMKMKLIVT